MIGLRAIPAWYQITPTKSCSIMSRTMTSKKSLESRQAIIKPELSLRVAESVPGNINHHY
jgi:hypothetical protein